MELLPSWDGLFCALDELNLEQGTQKQQGLNDFTLLGSVLSVNDEVRLHTRFIYALLNPSGKHYQGTLFLELFLNSIGRQGWLDLSSVSIRKEYVPNGEVDQIDLYITDGSRQLVIENKLNAQDQKRQVARYLRAVGATDPEQANETLFIYLTKGRTKPSRHGLGELNLCEQATYLVNAQGQPLALYQNLSYRRNDKDTIHAWIEACAKVVEINSNVAWALADYQAIVERATSEYVSKVKTLKEFLDEGINQGKQYHEQAMRLTKELPKIHASWLDNVMTAQLDELFEESINSGLFTKISKENHVFLKPFVHNQHLNNTEKFLYEPKFNFFNTNNGTKNRGAFYLLESGVLAKNVIVFLLYGSKMLHVGCLLTEYAASSPLKELEGLKLSELSGLKKGVFPNLKTYAEPLNGQGIIHLASFASSPQKVILEKLITTFSKGI